MTAQSALACLALTFMMASAAMAQDPTGSQTTAPPVITNETIGILRQHQVGSIILPEGKPPFPAVVVLHGCNGVSQNTFVWARRLASWGYAALIINSFNPRGLHQVCDGSRALPGPERAHDAFAAAAYLRTRSDIDADRIAVLGYSHGGWTALNASTQKNTEQVGAPPFRAIVAYYPFCPDVAPALATDVQIFIGDTDDWASAARCTAFVEKYAGDVPHRPSVMVYTGARHSFDANQPDRVYFGHQLAYDPKATADALERTRKFLDAHMQR
jgi:dienelactone hydrolase